MNRNLSLVCCRAPLASMRAGVQHRRRTADPTAPTAAKLTPEQIDAQWIAANSKYDGERKRILADVDKAVAAGPFRDDWQSLRTYQAPEWFRDAKFGIFIHWGVYSVAGFGSEWYSRNMYQQGSPDFAHHIATYGPQATVRLQGPHSEIHRRALRSQCLGEALS